MAGQQFTNKLQEEVICPICMDILQDPATIDCGHSFCLQCIMRSREGLDSVIKCPLCNKIVKRDTIRPNWLLVNLVEKIQAMDPSEEQPEVKELKCPKHGERFHYFCESDGEVLCVACCGSKDHKFHNTILLEEAAQSFQVGIWGSLPCSPTTDQEFSEGLETVTSCLWFVPHCCHLGT